MDKKPIGYIPGKANVLFFSLYYSKPLDKKVKSNPKYQNVKKKLNTGLTIRNIQVLSNQLVAKRKGEHFHRIKHSQLEALLKEETQQESIFNLNQGIEEDVEQEEENIMNLNGNASNANNNQFDVKSVMT